MASLNGLGVAVATKELSLLPSVTHDMPRRPLVLVWQATEEVDFGAVAASLDMLPAFTLGLEGFKGVWSPLNICAGGPVWEASIHHHHCRVMAPTETPCESKGSFIRLLWDAQQGRLHPGEMSDRVLLAQAGVKCCGNPRDEILVRLVTDTFKDIYMFSFPKKLWWRGGGARQGGDLPLCVGGSFRVACPSLLVVFVP